MSLRVTVSLQTATMSRWGWEIVHWIGICFADYDRTRIRLKKGGSLAAGSGTSRRDITRASRNRQQPWLRLVEPCCDAESDCAQAGQTDRGGRPDILSD